MEEQKAGAQSAPGPSSIGRHPAGFDDCGRHLTLIIPQGSDTRINRMSAWVDDPQSYSGPLVTGPPVWRCYRTA